MVNRAVAQAHFEVVLARNQHLESRESLVLGGPQLAPSERKAHGLVAIQWPHPKLQGGWHRGDQLDPPGGWARKGDWLGRAAKWAGERGFGALNGWSGQF